jgi:dephospho-CoA kinase
MKWIGLTGGIGSGKSTVAEILRDNGVAVVDADAVARELTEKTGPGFGPVVKEFGPGIVNSAGEIDRRKLGEIVFADQKKLEKLESILHPLVSEQVKKIRMGLESQGYDYAVYDVPLLYEKKLEKNFDAVIVVSTSVETQVKRTLGRGNISESEVRARIKSQVPLVEKVKKGHHVIDNEGSREELKKQVVDLVKKLRHQAQE